MTALICYGSNVASSSTLTTADVMSTTTGGTETTTSATTAPTDFANNEYIEILSQGGTATGHASIPAPTGHGWLLDATTLEGQTIASGNWSAIVNFKITSSFQSTLGSVTIRFYKRSSGGTYTSIGSIAVTSVAYTSGTKKQVSFANTSMSSMAFSTGDKLYIDVWLESGPSAPNAWDADTILFYVSNSGTAGVANDMQVTTPGYSATGGGGAVHFLICDGYGGCFS